MPLFVCVFVLVGCLLGALVDEHREDLLEGLLEGRRESFFCGKFISSGIPDQEQPSGSAIKHGITY